MKNLNDKIIVIRGAGDIASGIINTLKKCNFKIIALETKYPSSIRRKVSYSECIYDGEIELEDVIAKKAENYSDIKKVWGKDKVPVIIDETMDILNELSPYALIDAIIAKKNLGTKIDMADITIGLGPGFYAGRDVDYVVETMRGHDLGRIINKGYAQKNTGIPGKILNVSSERVIHSPANGKFKMIKDISSIVDKGQIIAKVDDIEIKATISGVIRGMIRDGYQVKKGFKIIDIDPRISERKNSFTISDKARLIAGSVLQIIVSKINL